MIEKHFFFWDGYVKPENGLYIFIHDRHELNTEYDGFKIKKTIMTLEMFVQHVFRYNAWLSPLEIKIFKFLKETAEERMFIDEFITTVSTELTKTLQQVFFNLFSCILN